MFSDLYGDGKLERQITVKMTYGVFRAIERYGIKYNTTKTKMAYICMVQGLKTMIEMENEDDENENI